MTSFKITITFLDSSEESLIINENQDHYKTITDYIEEKRGHSNIDLIDEEGQPLEDGDEIDSDKIFVCIIKTTCECCNEPKDRLYDDKCGECWLCDNGDTLLGDLEECDDYIDYSLGVVNYRESLTLKYRVYFDEYGEQVRVEKRWNRMFSGREQNDDIEKVDGVLMVGEDDKLIMSSDLPNDAGDDIMDNLTKLFRCPNEQ